MTRYFVEVGDNCCRSTCSDSNKESCTGHGFIYKNHDAYAVYYVGWSEPCEKKVITFALAVGEWSDGSVASDRTCFGFEAYESKTEILFKIIEPSESPWPKTDLMGEMLNREQALNSSLIKEVFLLAEEVVRNHPAVKAYLDIPQ